MDGGAPVSLATTGNLLDPLRPPAAGPTGKLQATAGSADRWRNRATARLCRCNSHK
jgi:hypothetical protein